MNEDFDFVYDLLSLTSNFITILCQVFIIKSERVMVFIRPLKNFDSNLEEIQAKCHFYVNLLII